MKLFCLAILLSLFSSVSFAQNAHQIKGKVTDTASNAKLYYATISVLNAKDSTLYKFVRADEEGDFTIGNLKSGKFILLLTYPQYADYVTSFSLDSTKKIMDFGNIDMKSMARVLSEVIIKGKAAAIKIKGDTTEFNASSYSIQPNDKVEDLIKKLPGIQVDKDGKITAQGKAVQKVLVDGEEFFGDDPTLVTQNLRADMVDKVQLFEKSSDQAAFTGVDDGQKTQTINIKLKEDKKKGYFGKIDAGYGTDNFYSAQGLFNRFKAKQKYSVYGTSGNNGRTGLSWEDSGKLGTGSDNTEFIDGGIYITYGGEDFGGSDYYGEGIPLAHSGGLHFDTKFNNDKATINTNYKVNNLAVSAIKNTLNQNNLPTGLINTNSDEARESSIFRQKLDATYTLKLDTTSNLKVVAEGTLKNNDITSNFSTEGRRGDNSLLNNTSRSNSAKGNDHLFKLSAFYNKKLKKLGRNYSINLAGNLTENTSNGFLKSQNNFYDLNGMQNGSQTVDQFKDNNVATSSFNANATYNEPITKALTAVFNYGFNYTNSNADKKSFNASTPGNYDILDAKFSNDFDAQQYTNQGGLVFNYKKPKTTFSVGTKVNSTTYNQFENYTQQSYNRSFLNYLPQATYQYKFSQQKSFRINYTGSTNQPTVTQLQPVQVNDDPLNIPLGNPDLTPSYRNNFSASYNSYKVLSDQNMYISGSYGFVNNNITSSIATDAQGKSVYQAINFGDKRPTNFYLYGRFSRKVKFLGVSLGVNLQANGNTGYSFINNELNKTTSISYSPSLNIDKYNDKISFNLSFGPTYSEQKASLQPQFSNKGWGRNGYGYIRYNITKKFLIGGDAEYTYTPKSASFDSSFEQTVINANVSKKFFKDNNVMLSFKANDILNQNRGFRRYASGNSITQTNYNNISRYFMVSLTWDFTKFGGLPTKP